MIIIMGRNATAREIANVTARVEQSGRQVHLSAGEERTIVGVVGDGRPLDREQIERTALSEANVSRFVEGKTIRKRILVPGKLLNLVV